MSTITIDIQKVLETKSPFLAKIPFFVSWLKKTVHEKEINECLRVCGQYHGAEFATQVIKFFGAQVNVVHTFPLQADGRYIFAANHPLGGFDGIALLQAISSMFLEIRFPVNDLLLAIENFQPIFMPINKLGIQNREAVKIINVAHESIDQQILMFPAGLVSRKIKGEIVDLDWQKHFISKAMQYKRDIVPVYIDGRNSDRFYRLANWRKRLGIKANIEMLYLPDEMFRQKNKTITITIGKPIPCTMLKNQSPQEWADFVKFQTYALA